MIASITSRLSTRPLLLLVAALVLLAAVSWTAWANNGYFAVWVDTGTGGCGLLERCAEWCEFVPGQGMVGTGTICCVPQHAVGTDDWGACIR